MYFLVLHIMHVYYLKPEVKPEMIKLQLNYAKLGLNDGTHPTYFKASIAILKNIS